MSRGEQPPVWPIYRRLLGYTRPYGWFLGAALVGMVIEAVAGASFVRLMKPLTNAFVAPEPYMAVMLPLALMRPPSANSVTAPPCAPEVSMEPVCVTLATAELRAAA